MRFRPIERLTLLIPGFALLTALVWMGATDALDAAVLSVVVPFRGPALDEVFQLVVLLGSPVVSGLLALGLALRFTATEGRRGLVPLLLFAAIAAELLLKAIVFQPGPPSELVRDPRLLFSARDVVPYTYPSGNVLAVTFLAVLAAEHDGRLRLPLAILVGTVALGGVYLAGGWLADVTGGLLLGLALAAVGDVIGERLTARPARGREPLGVLGLF